MKLFELSVEHALSKGFFPWLVIIGPDLGRNVRKGGGGVHRQARRQRQLLFASLPRLMGGGGIVDGPYCTVLGVVIK